MFDPRTPYMTALLKSQETRLVNRLHLDRLAESGGPADARGILRDTDIGMQLASESWRDSRERDQVLWRYLERTFLSLEARRFFPREARRFSRAYLLKYDVLNTKATLQGLALGHEPALVPIGVMHIHDALGELAIARSAGEVADTLVRSGLGQFALLVQDFNPASGRKQRLAVEAALEGAYQRILIRRIAHLGGGHVLIAACGLMVDLANLGILCRLLVAGHGPSGGERFLPGGHMLDEDGLRDALGHGLHELPRRLENEFHRQVAAEVVAAYERSGSIAMVEAVVEKHRLAALRDLLAPQVAPAAVLAWFMVSKEIELRNVRLILTAIEEGLALEDVRRHVLL